MCTPGRNAVPEAVTLYHVAIVLARVCLITKIKATTIQTDEQKYVIKSSERTNKYHKHKCLFSLPSSTVTHIYHALADLLGFCATRCSLIVRFIYIVATAAD